MSSNSPFSSINIQDMVDTLTGNNIIGNNMSLADRVSWLGLTMNNYKLYNKDATKTGAQQILDSYMDIKIQPQIEKYINKKSEELEKHGRAYVACCRGAIRHLIQQDPIVAKLCTFGGTSIANLEDKYCVKNGVFKSTDELDAEQKETNEEHEHYQDELNAAISSGLTF